MREEVLSGSAPQRLVRGRFSGEVLATITSFLRPVHAGSWGCLVSGVLLLLCLLSAGGVGSTAATIAVWLHERVIRQRCGQSSRPPHGVPCAAKGIWQQFCVPHTEVFCAKLPTPCKSNKLTNLEVRSARACEYAANAVVMNIFCSSCARISPVNSADTRWRFLRPWSSPNLGILGPLPSTNVAHRVEMIY